MRKLSARSQARGLSAVYGGCVIVALAAGIAGVGATAASSSQTRHASAWLVTVSLTQTTSWRYDWERVETIDAGGGVEFRCTQSERGTGRETFRLRSRRAGSVELTTADGRVRVSRSRALRVQGTQARYGTLVRSKSGDPAGCDNSTAKVPDEGCGARRRSDVLRVLGMVDGRHFRVVAVRAGRSPLRCPTPPRGSNPLLSPLAQPTVAWGRIIATTGKFLAASRIADPATKSMIVRLTYRGSTTFVGRDPRRPEQKGTVATAVRATVVFTRR